MEEVVKSVFGSISTNFAPAFVIIAILMPFWYIALYLFHKDFYTKNSQVLIWSFCFCFSFVWFAYSIVLYFLLYENNIEQHLPKLDSPNVPLIDGAIADFYFFTGYLSLFSLFLIIGYNYLRHRNKPKSFITVFLSGSIGLFGGMLIWFIIGKLLK